jgi:hypothetical protein
VRSAGFVFLSVLILASQAIGAPILRCERERYYAGDTIQCRYIGQHAANYRVEVLGKQLKRGLMHAPAAPRMHFRAPKSIRTQTSIRILIQEFITGQGEQPWQSTTLQVYPRAGAYYLDPRPLRSKRIALDDPTGQLAKELDALRVPYEKVQAPKLTMKRFDLLILGRGADLLATANTSPVVQLDVTTHVDDDPLTRELLAKRIRAALDISAAKDSKGSRSKL